MESESNWTAWIIIAVVLGLLLSCAFGALTGAAAGYVAGSAAAKRAIANGMRTPNELPWRFDNEPDLPPLPDIPDMDWLMGGALIVDVVDEGPADEAGLMVGDIVTAVDGRELDDDWSLADAIGDHDPGDMVALDVTRGHRQRTVEVELGRNPQLGGETPWLGVSYRDMGTLGRGPGDAPRRFELPFPRRRD